MTQVLVSMRTIDLRKADMTIIEGDDVKTLQTLLNLFLSAGDVGEDGTPIPLLQLDGRAASKTKAAILAFQTAAGLVADGIVGALTWKKLVEQDY
jgi:peptidoglycan hydrolase-like protein with peptidoglycan-binding domain